MRRTYCSMVTALLVVSVSLVASAQVKVVSSDGATLNDLMREEALVTVVLKGSLARVSNLRITGVHKETIAFESLSGSPLAFLISAIQEIRVQNSRINDSRRGKAEGTLTADDRATVNRATERTLQIFRASKGNQSRRMLAAMVLTASEHASKANAQRYLEELAAGNDTPTAMQAGQLLYLTGTPPSDELLQEGFFSGNRDARAQAARLASLTDKKAFLPEIRIMLRDPAIEIFPAAAIAVARMDDRKGIQEIYDALRALRDAKADAAGTALSILGGEDVRQEMLSMLATSRGMEWFRIVHVLYNLGDSGSKELMLEALRLPAFQRTAALILAKDGDLEGLEYLREHLKKQQDPNIANLLYKANIAMILYLGGDIQAKVLLQELIDIKPSIIYARGRTGDQAYKEETAADIQQGVCMKIAASGAKDLISMLAGAVESSNSDVALAACTAVMAIANREFGERMFPPTLWYSGQ